MLQNFKSLSDGDKQSGKFDHHAELQESKQRQLFEVHASKRMSIANTIPLRCTITNLKRILL